MADPNIEPNLQGYQLDENGQLIFNFAAGRRQFTQGPSGNEQELNGFNDDFTAQTSVEINSGTTSRGGGGTGMGRGRGRGGGGSTATTSTQGKQRVNFTKKNRSQAEISGETQPSTSSSNPPPSEPAAAANEAPATIHSAALGPQAQARAELDVRLSNGNSATVREVAYATGKVKRLTNCIKDKLKHLTLEYQKKIHELTITHEVRSEILFKWVGGFNKIKGPNRFNNYCRYAHEALQLFARKEFPPGERMQQVGEKWRGLSEAEQLKYNDVEFLNKLQQAIGLAEADNPEDPLLLEN